MKTLYWYILGGIVLTYVALKNRSGAAATTQNTQNVATAAIINGLATPDAGFYSGTTAETLKPLDATVYGSGWYGTSDGGYVNTETGETLSVGASPPRYLPSGPTIDLSATINAAVLGAATPEEIAASQAANPWLANAVIY